MPPRHSQYPCVWFVCLLQTDMDNLLAAAQNDANATDQLKADVAKFVADRAASLAAFEADLARISADRAQLVADLTALQNQPPLG